MYEKLGHAEVVQLELHGEGGEAEQQMAAFADTYFSQFVKTPFGMMRSVSMAIVCVCRFSSRLTLDASGDSERMSSGLETVHLVACRTACLSLVFFAT